MHPHATWSLVEKELEFLGFLSSMLTHSAGAGIGFAETSATAVASMGKAFSMPKWTDIDMKSGQELI